MWNYIQLVICYIISYTIIDLILYYNRSDQSKSTYKLQFNCNCNFVYRTYPATLLIPVVDILTSPESEQVYFRKFCTRRYANEFVKVLSSWPKFLKTLISFDDS